MLRYLLVIFGWIFAKIPRPINALICNTIGASIYYLLKHRSRMMLANLYTVFPERSESWRKKVARSSCCRMIEMGLFLAASPFLSKKYVKKNLTFSKNFDTLEKESREDIQPRLVLVPHLSLIEYLLLYPAIRKPAQELGTIYRPLDNKSVDEFVLKSRSHCGVKLFSRKQGLKKAISLLKANGILSVFFDQNAGNPGVLSLFCGKIASTTELPDILRKNATDGKVHVMFVRRKGFWSAEVDIEAITPSPTSNYAIVYKSNEWLEEKLKTDENICENWLWFHNRWRTQDEHFRRFQIRHKRNGLEENLAELNLKEMPRNERIMIRLPNWLGDVVMAIPLIKAIRRGRPDMHITLLSQAGFIPLLEKLDIADEIIGLPKKGLSYYFKIRKLRKKYPATHLLFTNSERGDIEAYLIGAPQRFGAVRAGRKRRLLTHPWALPNEFVEKEMHQTRLWEHMLGFYGLQEGLDLEPLKLKNSDENDSNEVVIGLICGTENSPEKRWPVEYWRELIEKLLYRCPGVKIQLFGTFRDREITEKVSNGFDREKVVDLAGKTNLLEFAERLEKCSLVICNDTGGMHLANMLGCSLIAIFGPTNPIRTGPIFNGPAKILQPYDCPLTGGCDIKDVLPKRVIEEAEKNLETNEVKETISLL